jgi:hypothetical protein
LFLRPAAEHPRSTLPEQVAESTEILIRDPIEVPRCSHQSGTPYKKENENKNRIESANSAKEETVNRKMIKVKKSEKPQ